MLVKAFPNRVTNAICCEIFHLPNPPCITKVCIFVMNLLHKRSVILYFLINKAHSVMKITLKRSRLNMIIDLMMFPLLTAMAGIGFLIKYVLVPGFERNARYGSDVELYFWGMDRHQWGTIHLVISIAFLVLLILHIVFHWKMIVTIIGCMFPLKMWRNGLAVVFGVVSLGLIVFPLLVDPEIEPALANHRFHDAEQGSGSEIVDLGRGKQLQADVREAVHENTGVPVETIGKAEGTHGKGRGRHQEDHLGYDTEIYGFLSMDDIAEKYDLEVSSLAGYLGVPLSESSERVGRLRRWYDFEMNDIRNYVIRESEKKGNP